MNSFDSLIFKKMSEHYESLLQSGNLSDAVLVVGEKEIKVHNSLSTRSPVFAAMFAHDTKEAQENRVQITDVDVDVLEMLVRFIYTGKIGALGMYTADLFIAADKYQMDCLKSICRSKLFCQIDSETVSDILIFADMYQDTELNTGDLALRCLDFIIPNGTEVMASEGWKKVVMRADLMGKLSEHLYSKYSNLVMYSTLCIYTGKVEGLDRYADKLLVAAHKYQVDCLKSICERQLSSLITTESVSNLLVLADMHQCTELTAKCVEYIIDNATQVKQQEDWKKIVARADLVTTF